jgi:hypothetical protein
MGIGYTSLMSVDKAQTANKKATVPFEPWPRLEISKNHPLMDGRGFSNCFVDDISTGHEKELQLMARYCRQEPT